ncbi:hypothetical protein EJ04DRAFT_559156 [Polyplosphaeria fusca]|uniref:Uncharacterized protein n=1 Tax=Polyplosphaeria fusca TaxID=682080 RepID=A0A9P4V811_9PLEO|nr:hypothetical protein EJ04DRAFT_559156 [Polyplosphaeria fusca]
MGSAKGGFMFDFEMDTEISLISSPNDSQITNSNFIQTTINMLQQRQLVITKRGFMGLAPQQATKVGMPIFILLGCSMPVLLQQHNNHYHFTGSIHVQGWMDGEMLEGMGKNEEIFQKIAHEQQPLQIQ